MQKSMRLAVMALLSFLSISSMGWAQQPKPQQPQSKGQMNSQKLATTLYLIENFYVDTTNIDKVTENAIVAALKELDPHSAYISKKDVEKANEPLVGSFEGIGVTFQLIRDTITVISPTAGGPSEKVGIMAGDQFIKIDGEESVGKKVDNEYVQKHLRGKKGTKVTVSVKRGNDKELIDFEIIRDKIPLNSINAAYMLDNHVGYIKLDRFAQESTQEFKEALAKLQAQGMESLIFDLRGNTGGYLNTAIELVDQFITEDKLIVFTEGMHSPRQEWRSTKAGLYTIGKLVVLIDEGSASASEILSGAIQDHDRGVVIGRRSFGKGLVQRPFNLPDGSQIRLTTSRYHTPSGRCIQRPYEKGAEDYAKEMEKRLKHGEYYHADSIHFPDSLKYKTDGGRTVYGGGGIMPDIFIPVDTAYNSKLYTNLVRKGALNRFTTDYGLKHRDEIKAQYGVFDNFNKDFVVGKDLIDGLKDAAKEAKVDWNDEQFAHSEIFLLMQMKALIARNVWETQQYYQVMSIVDPGIQKALDVLSHEKEYKRILKGK
jgi:carboxyl-terminal processing protease